MKVTKLTKQQKALQYFLFKKGYIVKSTAQNSKLPKGGASKAWYDFADMASKGDWQSIQELANDIREMVIKYENKIK